ncbi:MAG: NYN domain-containing protein, partial [Chitinispirillia bacterium]|nr:NYN domain-containing protein [Chitinispirillia bacterium]
KSIYGEFRKVTKCCRDCNSIYNTYEEKETDVNIAIKLYQQAYKNTYDVAIILSGDSDQIPAIRAIKRDFPTKKIGPQSA